MRRMSRGKMREGGREGGREGRREGGAELTVMMLSQERTLLKLSLQVTSYTMTKASALRKYTEVRALWNLQQRRGLSHVMIM